MGARDGSMIRKLDVFRAQRLGRSMVKRLRQQRQTCSKLSGLGSRIWWWQAVNTAKQGLTKSNARS